MIVAAAVAGLLGVILSQTRWGRYTYAIGSNPEAARRASIRVSLHVVSVYAVMGLLAGLAGFLSSSQYGNGLALTSGELRSLHGSAISQAAARLAQWTRGTAAAGMMVIELAATPWQTGRDARRRPPELQIVSLTDSRLTPLILGGHASDQGLGDSPKSEISR